MKDWQWALLSVFVFVVGTPFGAIYTRGVFNEASVERGLLEAELLDEEARRDRSRAFLEALETELAGSVEFEEMWRPHTRFFENVSPVIPRLQELADANLVVASGRSTPAPQNLEEGSRVQEVRIVNFTVTGDYRRVMEWFLDVERTFPFARFREAELRAMGGNETRLQVQLMFPSLNYKERQ